MKTRCFLLSFATLFVATVNRQVRPYAYGEPWSKHIWLTGRIKSMGNATFVIKPELPAASDMKDHGFIRAAAGRAKLDDLARTNLNALTQWLDDAKSGAVYTFTVGNDIELFLKGGRGRFHSRAQIPPRSIRVSQIRRTAAVKCLRQYSVSTKRPAFRSLSLFRPPEVKFDPYCTDGCTPKDHEESWLCT